MVADIVLIAIVLILAVVGYVKSFSGILTDLLSVVCVALGVVLLAPQVAALFSKMGMEASIAKSLAGSFAGDQVLSSSVIAEGEDPIGSLVSELTRAGLPAFAAKPAGSLIAKLTSVQAGMKVPEILGVACARVIDYAIAGVVVIILICIVFSLLKKLFRLTHVVKALRVIDGLLGVCLAVCIFAAIVMVGFSLLGKYQNVKVFQTVIDLVEQTDLWKYLYENNLLSGAF